MDLESTAVRRVRRSRPGTAVGIVALSTLLTMSVWFSATFVLPSLSLEWKLSEGQTSLLTIAVQGGFVVGALGSTASGLADGLSPRKLMCFGAFGAAFCNAGLLWCDDLMWAVPARFGTGMFLALVYPPALKEVSTWFVRGRGKALGLMIGALTLGSALPHLVGAAGGLDWRVVIAATSLLGIAGGLVVLLVRGQGPYPFPRRPFSFAAGFRSMRTREVALANVGYVGHMWELYAMWAGVGAFILSLPELSRPSSGVLAPILAFFCIGVGAVGSFVGGVLSDRWGRARAAFISLVCSGAAALALGLTYQALPFWVIIALCGFWGFWVIADSAQFSALVAENAEPEYVGGALSLQLALGYTTTALTLWLVPQIVEHASWNLALCVLAIGPALGAAAMWAVDKQSAARMATAGS
ncbi:MFS transporter [Leucobacter sp. CSA1]|uniref:MFS transporter n=1 Tax=Leucobacter chromiisoli TaxID=2796471 RepID=A0A934UUP9_9MICO|nr:MFS transporter [Leucobacter chromiisoli]MBK0419045.1 MFS transporter [Leucobacter chromiisoli]